MQTILATANPRATDTDWVPFSGGELEGRRPRALCPSCRDELNRAVNSRYPAGARVGGLSRPAPRDAGADARAADGRAARPLCFQCYRVELERQRAMKAAGDISAASSEGFQVALPLEPVNRVRLERLRLERGVARLASQSGRGRFADRRRHAQIAARHALERLADGLRARGLAGERQDTSGAWHAEELQLPESWLPFASSR